MGLTNKKQLICLCLAAWLAGAVTTVAGGRAGPATYTTTSLQPASGAQAYVAAVAATGRDPVPQYGQSFEQLDVTVTPETASRLRVKVAPTGVPRWEVPEMIVARPGPEPGLRSSSLLYDVSTGAPGQPFELLVTRRATKEPLFDTRGTSFIFKDQFIEITTAVPAADDLYGLGEVSLPTGLRLPRDGSVITLWARDLPSALPYVNLYGSHPFYMQVSKDGSAHGVLFLNSNGMDVLLNATSLTWRAIGGLVDLYFFLGPTPDDVIRQYHEVIGAPAMPPYWSLGFHQTRWGYANMSVMEQVVDNYTAAGLPLEVIWSDIEYMPTRFWTMEFDQYRYPADKMRALVRKLQARGQHWVAIQDAGVAADVGYHAYEAGTQDRVWITDENGTDYLGQVWPGRTVYPDYLGNERTLAWLRRELKTMHDSVPYNGLWLDMNEASNFCSGMQCAPDEGNKSAMYWLNVETPRNYDISELIPHRTSCQMRCVPPAPSNKLETPPYSIHNWGGGWPHAKGDASIGWKTIAPSALHANGATEYDAHNLYGASMAMQHYQAMVDVTGKRPFLLTRSTFPGAGKWTAHWTGDNGANWENLFMSIAGVINTNMWGMPMAGADICGFLDIDWTDGSKQLPIEQLRELCARWASVGAFYPFSRNHYAYNARSHEFYQWPEVAAAASKAYNLRYRLLTYIYGAFFLAHQHGGAVARALLNTDPTDLGARDVTGQWLMGEGLLVSPVLSPGTDVLTAHFTAGAWYNAWDYSPLLMEAGGPVTLRLPVGDVGVHFRGGVILPLQPYATVTRDVRLAPVTLVVALPAHPAGAATRRDGLPVVGPVPPYASEQPCAAARARHPAKLVSCGLVYMDAGDNVEVGPSNSLQVWFTDAADASRGSGILSASVKAVAGNAAGKMRLEAVHILGVAPRSPGAPEPRAQLGSAELHAEYDAAVSVLRISSIEHTIGEPLELRWSV